MSDNDAYDAYVARVLAGSTYANTSLTLFEAGILFFMAAYGLSVFLETPKDRRKGQTRYIVISFALVSLLSLSAALDSFVIFKCLFEATSAVGYLETVDENMRAWQRYLSVVCILVTIFIGDLLLVYRCYVIWQHRWWVAIPPVLTCIAAFVVGIIPLATTTHGELTKYSYELTRTLLTVSTNIMVTGLISFYLLHARRSLSKVLPSRNLDLYTGVVATFVESAAPLTFFGIIYAASIAAYPRAPANPSNIGPYHAALNIFAFFFFCFCTVSPSMIIFRITTGRSWVRFPQESNGQVSTDINFAHHSAEPAFMES